MTKYILAVILGMLSMAVSKAQRLLPDQKGLEITVGMLSDERIGNDYYINAGLTINGRNGNYRIFSLEYMHQYHEYKELHIPLETYLAEGGYSFFLLGDYGRNITFNAGVTGVVGYESINRGDAMLYDGSTITTADNFIYGVGGRLSFETYLSDRFVFLLQGRIKALWGTDLRQFRPSAGAGFRFNF